MGYTEASKRQDFPVFGWLELRVVGKNQVFIVLVLLWFVAAACQAGNVIYVNSSSPNEPGSGTFADPFRQIQSGIAAAANSDTVQIQPGIYSGPGNYDLDPSGKSITICSSGPNDPGIIARTIINPEQAGRGFYIHMGEDTNCVISGLTITNTRTIDGDNGAGIYCFSSSPTIHNCVIMAGYATGSGGGICFDDSNTAVIDCTITGNSAGYYGGGISSRFSSPTIIGCTIRGNTAGIEGGGIDSGMSDPNIFNCTIIDNNAPLGGGINCYYPGVAQIVNCTIAANSSDYVGGGVHCWFESSVIIKNSIFWVNSAPDGPQLGLEYEGTASFTYCDAQGGQTNVYDPCGLLVWGDGNIDSDPCFASFDANGDPNLWDLHLASSDGRWNPSFYRIDFNNNGIINLVEFAELADVWLEQGNIQEDIDNSGVVDWLDIGLLSQYYLANSIKDGWITDANTSPCIDSGDPNSDWAAEPWPNGKRINMGAYGGTNQASKSGNIADFNTDGKVNFTDFAIIAWLWDKNTSSIEDVTRDGIVNIGDLDILAENWLWEKQQ